MNTGYLLDSAFLAHRASGRAAHPERPERLLAIQAALEGAGLLARMSLVEAREATRRELEAAHDAGYLDELERSLARAPGFLDQDTFFNASTRSAAWRAAGGAIELVTRIARGELDNGIALVRPPGHHATRDHAMGFCVLNHVAIAARALQSAGLASRILLFDWDVHHGNGTENVFWDDPNVLFVSIHQSPNYPGTGPITATGGTGAVGGTVNIPLPPGSGDADYLAVFDRIVVPAAKWFAPDFVLISAGYDAWAADPLADMNVSRNGFQALAQRTLDLAGRRRIAAVLEGGYDLEALGGLVADLARVFLGDELPSSACDVAPSPACASVIDRVLSQHQAGWRIMR